MTLAVIITNAGQAANADGGKCETNVIIVRSWEQLEAVIQTALKRRL